MNLEQAASAYEAQGYRVSVKPSIIGSSGAVYNPDLLLVREGTAAALVLAGVASATSVQNHILASKDLNAEAWVIADGFAPDAEETANHYGGRLIRSGDLAPPEPAPGPALPSMGSVPTMEEQPPTPPERLPLDAFPAGSHAGDPTSNAFVLRDPAVWRAPDRLAEVQRVIREGRTFERTALSAPGMAPPPTFSSPWLAKLQERKLLARPASLK